jgi:hypothetical protein
MYDVSHSQRVLEGGTQRRWQVHSVSCATPRSRSPSCSSRSAGTASALDAWQRCPRALCLCAAAHPYHCTLSWWRAAPPVRRRASGRHSTPLASCPTSHCSVCWASGGCAVSLELPLHYHDLSSNPGSVVGKAPESGVHALSSRCRYGGHASPVPSVQTDSSVLRVLTTARPLTNSHGSLTESVRGG